MNKNPQLVGVVLSALACLAVVGLAALSAGDTEMLSLATDELAYPTPDIRFQTSPSELVRAYKADTDIADGKFKGKTFKVVGVIDYIETETDDDAYVVMRAGIPHHRPRFQLDPSEKATGFWLGKGMRVSLVCVGDGAIAGVPVSRRCIVAK